jgi:hypothetical protein
MNRVLYSPRLSTGTGTIGTAQHAKLAAAVLLHLGHEWKTVQLAAGIERHGYFRRASDFDQLTGC